MVIIDEAYVNFGGQCSALGLLDKYPNLFITRTFSKDASLEQDCELDNGVGSKQLISDDSSRSQFDSIPYNVDAISETLALAAVEDLVILSTVLPSHYGNT